MARIEQTKSGHTGYRGRIRAAAALTVLAPLAAVVAVSLYVTEPAVQTDPSDAEQATLDIAGHFLLGVVAVLAVSHILGHVAVLLRQPRVTGEIVGGILLGPSLLGSVAPGAARFLFPAGATPMFNGLAQLGLVLFMFGVGQELGAMRLRGAAPRALLISQASLLVPFAAGALIALPLMGQYMAGEVRPVAFVLFIGCALSITAFPVLARILGDLGLTRTRPGQLSLFAAAVGDGGSWLILSVILSLAHGSNPAAVLGRAIAVLGVVALFVGPLRRLAARWPDREGWAERAPTGAVLLVIAVAATSTLTAALGIHQLIGALLVGLVWPQQNRAAVAAAAPLSTTAKTVLLPFFFLGFGLNVNLRSLHLDGSAGLVLLALIVVATLAKVIGPGLCARLTGLPWRESVILGVLLNARGLTELVVIQIGYQAHIISQQMLGMLTIVALATTVMTAPLLRAAGSGRGPQQPVSTPAEPVEPVLAGTATLSGTRADRSQE